MPAGFIIHWGMEAAKEKQTPQGVKLPEKGKGKHTGPRQLCIWKGKDHGG